MVVVGLITCERVVLGKGCQRPHLRECAGYLSPHIMDEDEDPENEQDDRREEGQQQVEGRESQRVRTTTS